MVVCELIGVICVMYNLTVVMNCIVFIEVLGNNPNKSISTKFNINDKCITDQQEILTILTRFSRLLMVLKYHNK